MATTHTFTLTGENIAQGKIDEINGRICEMIRDSLNAKLDGFKTTLGKITDVALEEAKTKLMDKMHLNFISAFNTKLNEFSAEVARSDFSQDLTSKLIADLGVKFRDAIEGGFDNPSIEYYAKFIKFMEGLKNDKLGITEVDEAINAIEAAIEAAEKAAAEKATEEAKGVATKEATEKAKNAAKNAAEKANKEAGKNATAEVTAAAAAVESAAAAAAAAAAAVESAVDLDALKVTLTKLKGTLEELKTKLGTMSGGQRKTIKNKTIKNKTKKKKQVKTKTIKNKTIKKKQVKTKPKTKIKTKTKRKHT